MPVILPPDTPNPTHGGDPFKLQTSAPPPVNYMHLFRRASNTSSLDEHIGFAKDGRKSSLPALNYDMSSAFANDHQDDPIRHDRSHINLRRNSNDSIVKKWTNGVLNWIRR